MTLPAVAEEASRHGVVCSEAPLPLPLGGRGALSTHPGSPLPQGAPPGHKHGGAPVVLGGDFAVLHGRDENCSGHVA